MCRPAWLYTGGKGYNHFRFQEDQQTSQTKSTLISQMSRWRAQQGMLLSVLSYSGKNYLLMQPVYTGLIPRTWFGSLACRKGVEYWFFPGKNLMARKLPACLHNGNTVEKGCKTNNHKTFMFFLGY